MNSQRTEPIKCTSPTHLRAITSLRQSYKLVEVLGRGANGTVYRAVQRSSKKAVAIKEVQCPPGQFYKLKQILREIAILRHLSSQPGSDEYLAKLLEVLKTEPEGLPALKQGDSSVFYIVMEYVEGVTLKQLLDKAQAKKTLLSSTKAAKITRNLLRAVEFIHKAGVLHRDLKPDNFLITRQMKIKILDFGLARDLASVTTRPEVVPRTSEERENLAITLRRDRPLRKERRRNLSPHVYARLYRPPEVCLLEKEYSYSADIWAVGCIICEVLQCQQFYNLGSEADHARFTFKAASCLPLSPLPALEEERRKVEALAQGDLIDVILEVLGDQSDSSLSYISRKNSEDFVKSKFTGATPIIFEREFEDTPAELAAVVGHCLEFNPFFRLTASDLLKIPVFTRVSKRKEVDRANHEESASVLQQLRLDIDRPRSFDYDKLEPIGFSLDDVKVMIEDEIERLNTAEDSH